MPRKWKQRRHGRLKVELVVTVHQCHLCELLGLVGMGGVPAQAQRPAPAV